MGERENVPQQGGAIKATAVAELMAELERDGLPDAPAPTTIAAAPAPPAIDDTAPYDEIAISGIDPGPSAAGPSAAPTPTGSVKRTPSVADLMAELEQEEATAGERASTWLQAAASRLIELDQRKATLAAHRDPADPMRSHFLEASRQAASKAGQLLDEKTAGDEQEVALREQLLDAFLALQRLIGELDKGEALADEQPPAEPKKSLKPQQALRAESPALKAERVRRRRIIAMGAIIGLLVLTRVGLYVWDRLEARGSGGPPVRELKHDKATAVWDTKAATEALKSKTPTLVSLHLVVTDGALRALATVAAATQAPSVTYTWYQNGEIVAVEGTGTLPASQLKPGARYKVEAIASVAGRSTNRLETPWLEYQPTSVKR